MFNDRNETVHMHGDEAISGPKEPWPPLNLNSIHMMQYINQDN